jgi:hypothetical protein
MNLFARLSLGIGIFISLHSSFAQETIVAERHARNPIIKPHRLKGKDGSNINGPSLIKVPDWVQNPLGKYYLYFAHHEGKYIRLAYTDDLKARWKIYEPGTLKMEDCLCNYQSRHAGIKHIASPDVMVDPIKKQFIMYFHCPVYIGGEDQIHNHPQVSLRATSPDGLNFKPDTTILGDAYFRVFKWNNYYYALAREGVLHRSLDGLSKFEKGHNPFLQVQGTSKLRHSAVLIRQDTLYVFHSRIGDSPEGILLSKINLANDWTTWTARESITILIPERKYECDNLPLAKSKEGMAKDPVRELRDPAIFEEDGKLYLLYSVCGEQGIGIAELKFK